LASLFAYLGGAGEVRNPCGARSIAAAQIPPRVHGLCGLRFVVSFPAHGNDAIRDSAIWYYGIFAFLVAGAAVCDPTFTPRLLGWYRRM
jgi:hypothetical protein